MMDNIENEINNLDNEKLIQLCQDIYLYQKSGLLNESSSMYTLFKKFQHKYHIDIRYFETLILDLSAERFQSLIKVIIKNRPYLFIKD